MPRGTHAGVAAWAGCSAGSWLRAEKETFGLSTESGEETVSPQAARAKVRRTDSLEKSGDTQHDCTFRACSRMAFFKSKILAFVQT